MHDAHQDDRFKFEDSAHEGLFDAQLLFPAFGLPPAPLRTIVKRDGRETDYDVGKIAQAIFKAAQSIGGTDRDRAEFLAQGVTVYLMKRLAGRKPSVDDVHDAVEKVLIEMGHARTALAYVRYRDRRARIRKLREGDVSALMREMAEAQREPAHETPPSTPDLFVHSSADALAAWDRTRIVVALERETGLDRARAEAIALEVEQQIRAARVTALTAPLVRELVGAKLIEHGLTGHYEQHRRLGVPLYDAEQIVCGPMGEHGPSDPAATDRALARAVKREFALAHVFSGDVARAHMAGQLHIHGLGQVDRLYGGGHAPDYVKQFGFQRPGARGASRPPKYPDTLLAQLTHFGEALCRHFCGEIAWDALNVQFAPFLVDHDERGMRQVAQMLLYEHAHRMRASGAPEAAARLALCWDVPEWLRDIEAVGPGGGLAGQAYAAYERTAQRFAEAVLDVYAEGMHRGASFPGPAPVIEITPGLFHTPGHESFLARVGRAAVRRGRLHAAFVRTSAEAGRLSWQPSPAAAHCVTLNLPRAAYQARDEQSLWAALDAAALRAAQAHLEKRVFLDSLLRRGSLGPLALLASERAGRRYLDLDAAEYWVGVTGLNECVQALLGVELHESAEAAAFAGRVLERLAQTLAAQTGQTGLELRLAAPPDVAAAQRLAEADMRHFPAQARAVVKVDRTTHELRYTPGVQLNPEHGLSPIESVRAEGLAHRCAQAGAATHVRIPELDLAPETVARFLSKTFHQTSNRWVYFPGVD